MVAQREELRLARVAGRVLALGRVRELRAGAEHVAMRVDAARRQLEARLRWVRRTSRASRGFSRTVRSMGLLIGRSWPCLSRCTCRPAFSSGSRILYMSRPSTPAASFARFSPSLASRAAAASSDFRRQRGAARTTTPSSSATITSPGFTSAPAQTTGMLTEPSVALIVPLALIARLQTGKPISVSVLHVAHAAVDDQAARAARLERGRQQVAEEAVGAVGGERGDDDVAGLDLLGGDMHHPVVARLQQHGDRRARTPARPRRSAACRASSGRRGPSPRARWRAERRQLVDRRAVGALMLRLTMPSSYMAHSPAFRLPWPSSAASRRG